MSSKHCSPLSYEELNNTLLKLGLKENPEWLGLILFVRNLVNKMDIISADQKIVLQKTVIESLEKKDFSDKNMSRIIKMIQQCFTDSIKKELERTEQKLDNQKDFADTLISQIHILVDEFKKSVNRQSTELNEFGEKTISHIELHKNPENIVGYIRGTIKNIVADARSEAMSWENRAKSLENMARFDNLLKNLFNRSYLDDYLKKSIEDHSVSGRPLSLLMIDVDHFKKINDVWGHLIGDDVLKALAKLIRIHSDACAGVPCRYGGEELCVIFGNTDENLAKQRAETLRKDVESYSFVSRQETGQLGETIHFTISIGVAQLQNGYSVSDLISAADRAMYRAKDTGRNQVIGFSELKSAKRRN
ncbi:MAG: GGDEF domain-containing protein [Desulfonatronovibrio sp.]